MPSRRRARAEPGPSITECSTGLHTGSRRRCPALRPAPASSAKPHTENRLSLVAPAVARAARAVSRTSSASPLRSPDPTGSAARATSCHVSRETSWAATPDSADTRRRSTEHATAAAIPAAAKGQRLHLNRMGAAGGRSQALGPAGRPRWLSTERQSLLNVSRETYRRIAVFRLARALSRRAWPRREPPRRARAPRHR